MLRKHWVWIPVGIGCVLRLLWIGDSEFKGDEMVMFSFTQGSDWPAVGMASGAGLVNPGMSAWIFMGLAKTFGISDPLGLTRMVQILNVAALMLAAFLFTSERPALVPSDERDAWRWGIALAALNPFAILFSRKIWAQDVLALFCVLFVAAWWKRGSRLGAFGIAFLGMVMGQIHMSGFFLLAGVGLWTLWRDRRSVNWPFIAAGAIAGLIPLIPWLLYLLDHPQPPAPKTWTSLRQFRFWSNWLQDIGPWGLKYSLGPHFDAFKDYAGGSPRIVTYVSSAIAWLAVGVAIFRARFSGNNRFSKTLQLGWAYWFGFGILLSLARIPIHRHYLIVAFPMTFVWLAALTLKYAPRPRWVLGFLASAYLFISASFLGYIHDSCGAPQGDYGISYRCQADPIRAPGQ